MRLVYYDEAGDDGFPKYSSELFALSGLYLAVEDWRPIYDNFLAFRRTLKASIRLRMRDEIHTKDLLTGQGDFERLRLSDSQRRDTVTQVCTAIGTTPGLRIVSVVIRKPLVKNPGYHVLDTALTYSLQRIKNDLGEEHFLVITDDGRPEKMRRTIRKIQRFNYVPSMYGTPPSSQPMMTLIEDPLPKQSEHSYFVQMADTVVSVVYWFAALENSIPVSKRVLSVANQTVIQSWMALLKPAINLKAAVAHPFGIKYHPS